MAPTTDFDNTPRPQGQTIDIGPYEYITSPQSYTLTLTTSGTGFGSIEASPEGPYHNQDSVIIWANTSANSTFTEFTGDLLGSVNPQLLLIDENKTVNAEFIQENLSYPLKRQVQGNGCIIAHPDKPTYQKGEIVTIIAIPDTGWIFDHWEGDLNGTFNPTNITMNENKTITAYFTEQNISQIITITDIKPTNHSINIPINTTHLKATLYNNKQTVINWSITTSPFIGIQKGSLINGTITCPINNLQYNKTYRWTIHIQSENGWKNQSFLFTTVCKKEINKNIFIDWIYRIINILIQFVDNLL
jgi:hypothetical protein